MRRPAPGPGREIGALRCRDDEPAGGGGLVQVEVGVVRLVGTHPRIEVHPASLAEGTVRQAHSEAAQARTVPESLAPPELQGSLHVLRPDPRAIVAYRQPQPVL